MAQDGRLSALLQSYLWLSGYSAVYFLTTANFRFFPCIELFPGNKNSVAGSKDFLEKGKVSLSKR